MFITDCFFSFLYKGEGVPIQRKVANKFSFYIPSQWKFTLKKVVALGANSSLNTVWEHTVHVSHCAVLYSGHIFVPLCRKLIIFVF